MGRWPSVASRFSVWIGFDPRESGAFAVARSTALQNLNVAIPVHGLVLSQLRATGIYTRPTSTRDGRLWDDISQAPMSTEFAISRFLAPHLAGSGWALFMDADMLCRHNLKGLFAAADPDKAVMVVKHDFNPPEDIKMDGQVQTRYPRKNWSSVMLFNCDHPANRRLSLDDVNNRPGRDLHAFYWLHDSEIGELPASWNWLVDVQPKPEQVNIAHFTLGGPWIEGWKGSPNDQIWLDNR